MDQDDVFSAQDELRWDLMRAKGISEKEIERAKKFRQCKDAVALYGHMVSCRAWETDVSCDLVKCHIKLSAALDGINKREAAISLLSTACTELELIGQEEPRLILALAKLLFRADQKDRAMELCSRIFDIFDVQKNQDKRDVNSAMSVSDACDAYYLGGWIQIHNDDHTSAYRIWQQGYAAVSTVAPCAHDDEVAVELLRRQCSKRVAWDKDWCRCLSEGIIERTLDYVGKAPARSDYVVCEQSCTVHRYSATEDLEAFVAVVSDRCPALALFSPCQQVLGVVFRTKEPVLTAAECAEVLKAVYVYHEMHCGNVWSTVRHSSVKTTDVAVEDIAILQDWLLVLMHSRICPLIDAAFPKLIDGTSTMLGGASRIRIHDAFIVRYDAERDMSLSLPEHCDTSAVSVVVSLNQEDSYTMDGLSGDFSGGGTWFEALEKEGVGRVVNAGIGKAVIFAGPLKHAGFPITRGVRHILVLFLYVEGFHYGPYLSRATEEINVHNREVDNISTEPAIRLKDKTSSGDLFKGKTDGAKTLASGGAYGGFVVYKQTVDLVQMLEKSSVAEGTDDE